MTGLIVPFRIVVIKFVCGPELILCYKCSAHRLGSRYMDELYNKTHDKNGNLNSNIEGITKWN